MTETTTKTVTFDSAGATLVGTLHLPAGASADAPVAGAVVTGAWTTVKEQMAGHYAQELASRGVAALAFDFRGWGASEGAPRFVEDPAAKTADVIAAARALARQPEVDAARVGGLGICASAGYVAAAAAEGALSRIALVAPWLHNAEIVDAVYGGPEAVAGLKAASDELASRGEAQTIAAAGGDGALMGDLPYYVDPNRGAVATYDNRFDLRSWRPWLDFDAVALAPRISAPALIVHSDAAAIPDGAKAFSANLPNAAPALWLDDVAQFDFYDQAEPVRQASDAAAAHLGAA